MQLALSMQMKELPLNSKVTLKLKKCYEMIYNLPYVFSNVGYTIFALANLGFFAVKNKKYCNPYNVKRLSIGLPLVYMHNATYHKT